MHLYKDPEAYPLFDILTQPKSQGHKVAPYHYNMINAIRGNSCNVQYLWSDSSKYVNLYHPVSLSYWNPEVCWLTSPMGAIKMLHLCMMPCIIHVNSRSNEVCWLSSPMGAIKMIHWIMLTCKSMSTYITQYPLIIEILKYVDLHHPWVQSKCFTSLASSMCTQDPMKYAD